jgi:hypothetical protein
MEDSRKVQKGTSSIAKRVDKEDQRRPYRRNSLHFSSTGTTRNFKDEVLF